MSSTSRTRLSVAMFALAANVVAAAASADAAPARPAPPLPAPTGAVVNVSTEPQLQAAVRSLAPNTTIVIAPGTYVLTRTLYIKGVTGVGIRGATANADDVVLVGRGMADPNYGDVPFGIWTGMGVEGVTIANLTIRDFYFHPIIFNADTENPHVYNVHLIDAGEQFIKANPDGLGGGVDSGIVEYSVIEYTSGPRDGYPKGVDVQTANNWIIRHNLFRNIAAPAGQLTGPGVLAWRGSSNTVVEGNTFVNCNRGIMLGADDYYSPSHRGGVIRNNFFFRTASQPGDVGIILSDSPDTQILNNTVFVSGTYPSPIEYRYGGTRNVTIANNLVDGIILSRDDGAASLSNNYQNAGPALFVDAAAGDLHLSGVAAGAIDQGVALENIADDWDGEARPLGAGYDIGADERSAATPSYRIGGRVTDPAGTGLAGVTLTLSGARSQTMTTDGNGRYEVASLVGAAAYTVSAARAGYTFTPPSRSFPTLSQDQLSADFVATALTAPGSGATATFVRADSSTRGNWADAYGGDGYGIVGAAGSYPAYAQVSVTSAQTWTWASSTADARALQQARSADRLAACWYASVSFSIDVNLTDGGVHQVALYSVDWDGWGRSLRVDVLDAASGAALDTRTLSHFEGGQYLVWSLAGHVTLRVTNTGQQNAVASGIFFGSAGTASPGPPPSAGSATATFNGTDRTTRGSWNGSYGSQGYAIASDVLTNPAWGQVSVGSASTWIWSASAADPRAVQRPGGASRLAACWYSDTALTVDVSVTDGRSHQVALYALDWDPWGRSERLEVLDGASGAVLDTRALTSFDGGAYLVWTVTGHVTFRITNTGSPNAVLSGVFLD